MRFGHRTIYNAGAYSPALPVGVAIFGLLILSGTLIIAFELPFVVKDKIQRHVCITTKQHPLYYDWRDGHLGSLTLTVIFANWSDSVENAVDEIVPLETNPYVFNVRSRNLNAQFGNQHSSVTFERTSQAEFNQLHTEAVCSHCTQHDILTTLDITSADAWPHNVSSLPSSVENVVKTLILPLYKYRAEFDTCKIAWSLFPESIFTWKSLNDSKASGYSLYGVRPTEHYPLCQSPIAHSRWSIFDVELALPIRYTYAKESATIHDHTTHLFERNTAFSNMRTIGNVTLLVNASNFQSLPNLQAACITTLTGCAACSIPLVISCLLFVKPFCKKTPLSWRKLRLRAQRATLPADVPDTIKLRKFFGD